MRARVCPRSPRARSRKWLSERRLYAQVGDLRCAQPQGRRRLGEHRPSPQGAPQCCRLSIEPVPEGGGSRSRALPSLDVPPRRPAPRVWPRPSAWMRERPQQDRSTGYRSRDRSRSPGVRLAATHVPMPRRERQQILDRATAAGEDDHVDLGVTVERPQRRRPHTADGPWTATSRTRKRTAGHRRRAFSSTSCSAAEPRPHTKPTTQGRKGRRTLRCGANKPSVSSILRAVRSEQLTQADLTNVVRSQTASPW